MNKFKVNEKQVLYNVHSVDDCVGNCVIHNPSKHHLLDWPLHYRSDRQMFERICEHGAGHPDPDNHFQNVSDWTHGCHAWNLENNVYVMCCSLEAAGLRKNA